MDTEEMNDHEEFLLEEIKHYRARLEIDHIYDMKGNRIELPYDGSAKDSTPDGIECRDATIRFLNDELKAKERKIEKLNNRLEELEDELRLRGALF